MYAPNSYGGPKADPGRTDDAGLWDADGEMVRKAYTLRADDDDWGQAGTLVREVLDDAARERLVDNVVGHLKDGVSRAGAAAGTSSTGATSTARSAIASPPAWSAERSRGERWPPGQATGVGCPISLVPQ